MKIATVTMNDGTVYNLYAGAKYMRVDPTMIIGVLVDTNEGVVIPLTSVKFMLDGEIHAI